MKSLHFFTGKGGVGKTTLAALYSLYLTRQSKAVQLISLDPAHNIYDVFKSRSVPGIKITEIDLNKWLKKYMQRVEKSVLKSYRYMTVFNLEKNIKILRHAPAVEEYALLLAFQEIFQKSDDDVYLIFDMPPTALALKFFNLPSLSLVWIDTLMNLRSEILRKREMITRIKLGKKEFETDKVMDELNRQKTVYSDIITVIRNRDRTNIHVATNPDHLSISETLHIIRALEEQNLPIRRIIMNKSPDGIKRSKINGLFPNYQIHYLPLSKYNLSGKKNLDKYVDENYNYLGFKKI